MAALESSFTQSNHNEWLVFNLQTQIPLTFLTVRWTLNKKTVAKSLLDDLLNWFADACSCHEASMSHDTYHFIIHQCHRKLNYIWVIYSTMTYSHGKAFFIASPLWRPPTGEFITLILIWASSHLNTPAYRVFVQQFVQADVKRNIRVPHH